MISTLSPTRIPFIKPSWHPSFVPTKSNTASRPETIYIIFCFLLGVVSIQLAIFSYILYRIHLVKKPVKEDVILPPLESNDSAVSEAEGSIVVPDKLIYIHHPPPPNSPPNPIIQTPSKTFVFSRVHSNRSITFSDSMIIQNKKRNIERTLQRKCSVDYSKSSYKENTPLKNSIHIEDEFSSKLPVTALNEAPRRGADSNLHRYKINPMYIGIE